MSDLIIICLAGAVTLLAVVFLLRNRLSRLHLKLPTVETRLEASPPLPVYPDTAGGSVDRNLQVGAANRLEVEPIGSSSRNKQIGKGNVVSARKA